MTVSLITGTSSGIGLATAVRLALSGHRVIATMRDTSRADDLLSAVAAAGATAGMDLDVEVVELDVCDDASVAAAFKLVGPVDVLVNNAGTSPVAAVEDFPIADWQALFETNLFGVVRCTQAALKSMRERRIGHIINISSLVGRATQPVFGPYAASKQALEATSEALAAEVAPFGIRVTIIEPGAVITPIREKTGVPDRSSPYRPVAKNWGFHAGYIHARARGPEEVADAIAAAIVDPHAPLRIPVGVGVEELIELRSRLDDQAWVSLWSANTAEFLARYHELTGIDLTDRPAPS
ncbi:MAG: SDR family oxidoreductase [Actinomycetota bacterium]|nr:SDR family oxidoreductase [Actinomycetota bacterium]